MNNNYTPFHVHSKLSNGITNVDSITDFREYVEAAKSYGMTAMAISEHGSLFEWLHKKEAIEAAGMKYIHAIEAYITEDISSIVISKTADVVTPMGKELKSVPIRNEHQREDGAWVADAGNDEYNLGCFLDPESIEVKTLPNKIRDNYHCILIARNYDGVKELNKLVSHSFNRDDGHFYYMPRITLDELFTTTDNIIITTACLGGVLNNGTPSAKEKMLSFLRKNKNRCYLEIQHHNCADQIAYNKLLYGLSKELDIPLIAGTDTHALNDEHMDGRAMLQKAKGVRFSNEDEWDLTFKRYDQLVSAYEIQNSLPMPVVLEAIENTNKMAEMIEPFELDHSAKYPKLYQDSEAVFKQKINDGVLWRKINKRPNYKEYYDRIHYEFDTYKHNGAIDFMLLEEDYKAAMRKKGIKYGYSRGSVSGSIIAYLLGITEVDSVRFNLNFERFMNRERLSLADVDSDWLSEDRKAVKDYLYHKHGLYCCDIVTFNTIATKGAVNDVVRGFFRDNLDHLPDDLKKRIDSYRDKSKRRGGPGDNPEDKMPPDVVKEIEKYSLHKEVPYKYNEFSSKLNDMIENDEAGARKKYPNIFKYVDMVNGCVVSVGNHPAGVVVSPFPVDEWFGTFTTSTDEYPVSQLNMKEIDSLNFIKLDILGLDNMGLIYKTCDLAGIPFLTPDNTPADDQEVWDSIKEDTTMIFQWESSSATAYLKQLFSDATIEKIKAKNPNFSYMDLLSIGNGAIRPAGESYRDLLSQGIYKDNGNDALNEFLSSTLGYLVYQEQIIEFLHRFCGFTMGEADVVRRHFSKKTGTETDIPIIKDGGILNKQTNHHIKGFIQTMIDDYGETRENAEKIIIDFLQVIQDASDYLFSKNHADPYSWIGYICGYLRYHYPLEFVTTALNIFEDKSEKSVAIINYAKKNGLQISPIKFRHSIAEYSCDKEEHKIFKGISSIKYMNTTVANELYALRDRQYESFIDLLYDIKDEASLNTRQLRILIDLDFFSEFGDINYLNACADLFDKYYGKKQIRKDSLTEYNIDASIIRKHSEKETEKMYSGVDTRAIIKELSKVTHVKQRTLGQRIKDQIELLGYVDIMDDKYSGLAAVVDIDTKYAPKAKLYSLKNGTSIDCKIDKRSYNKSRIVTGDIIRIIKSPMRNKVRRNENGEYEPIPGQYERWITDYKKVDI